MKYKRLFSNRGLKQQIMQGYITLKEASAKWGIGDRRINALCLAGRIEGATRAGTMWLIPEQAKKPEDGRIKSGKYIKSKEPKDE